MTVAHRMDSRLRNGSRQVRVALAQIDPLVGDLEGNAAKILRYAADAAAAGADIVVFPELAVTGYPPEDLLLKGAFLRRARQALETVAAGAPEGIILVTGFVDCGDDIFNAAAVIQNGAIRGVHRKHHLPNYGVFDEERYFQRGTRTAVYDPGGLRFGVCVCEDIWYPAGPAAAQTLAGEAELVLVLNASPYHRGKGRERERMVATRAADCAAVVCYVNAVGGQDELVFDGSSFIAGPDARILARARAFEEQLLVCDVDAGEVAHLRARDVRRRREKLEMADAGVTVDIVPLDAPPARPRAAWSCPVEPVLDDLEEVYRALVTGTRDYVRKNGFQRVVVGLSGGIDSALTFAIACDALGPERVLGVTMPGPFSSVQTRADAARVAQNFGAELLELPIGDVFRAYREALAEPFSGLPAGLAEENLQARIRGNLLMAISNKLGHLVLTTGNKSEMACGYATLYGDMAGGFAVLKDVPKTLVWQLARHRNRGGEMIPVSTIERAPSAELRENQKDTDSLPPYDVLDQILQLYVEEDRSVTEIVERGFDAETVQRVVRMVDTSEYKRRQAPPGVKISPKAFGRDRRLPITNGFREW